MSEKDLFYRHLLQQCQSPDLSQRLAALEDLSKLDDLDLVPGQFLLDRLNSTSIEREQSAILEVMSQLPLPIPVEALLTILADRETSTTHLRAEVAHTLAVVKAKTAIAPLLRLLQEPSEDPDLRREIARRRVPPPVHGNGLGRRDHRHGAGIERLELLQIGRASCRERV